jgi:tetratricopeptide (TPR) repeat protein
MDDPDTEIARRHFNAGSDLYSAGQYERAIGEFKAARRARQMPAFDFNIARAYDRLEQIGEAIDWYQRYLASGPEDSGEIRARIEELKRRLDAQRPKKQVVVAPAPLPPPPPPPPRVVDRPPRALRIAGPTLIAVGAAVAAGGIAFGVLRNQAADDLSRADASGQPYDASRDRALHTDQALEGALIAVGAAAAVTGVVLTALGYRERRSRGYGLNLDFSTGGICVRF